MGLPAELRVMIYDFVFHDGGRGAHRAGDLPEGPALKRLSEGSDNPNNTSARSGDKSDSDSTAEQKHCCDLEPSEKLHGGIEIPSLHCRCSSSLFPELLSTNKFIFAEAMPIFYANVTVRIKLPDFAGRWYEPQRHLNRIPRYGKRYIKNLLLVSSTSQIGITVGVFDAKDARFSLLKYTWRSLRGSLSSIHHVRLHLDPTWPIDVEYFDAEAFAGMAAFPKLRTVRLELRGTCMRLDGREDEIQTDQITIGKLGDKITQAIKGKAVKVKAAKAKAAMGKATKGTASKGTATKGKAAKGKVSKERATKGKAIKEAAIKESQALSITVV